MPESLPYTLDFSLLLTEIRPDSGIIFVPRNRYEKVGINSIVIVVVVTSPSPSLFGLFFVLVTHGYLILKTI